MRSEPLLAWQWSNYPLAHADRRNLLIHLVTAPLFVAAPIASLLALAFDAWSIAALALLAMPLAVVAQGIGHRLEPRAPAPFEGPLDVVARIAAEQWIQFPRFVFSGGFARAWRAVR